MMRSWFVAGFVSALALLLTGCASAGKDTFVSTKMTALTPPTAAAPAAQQSPVIRLRYPAVILDDALSAYVDAATLSRLGYTRAELEKQRKFEKSHRIDASESRYKADAKSVFLTAMAKTTFYAAKLYAELDRAYPGRVVLEPLQIGLAPSGGFTTTSLDRAPLPPSQITVDFAIYSHPRHLSFAAKFVPLTTIRATGPDGSTNILIAPDGVASASPSSGSAGYTYTDFIQMPATAAQLAEEWSKDKPYGRLQAQTPLPSASVIVYPLEDVDLTKAPLRAVLENKATADPFVEAYAKPVASRVGELAGRLANQSPAASVDAYASLLFGKHLAEVTSLIGPDTTRDVARQAMQTELSFLTSSSEGVRKLTLDSDYGKSVCALIIEEIKHEQHEEVMNGVIIATALVGGGMFGAAMSSGGAAASQAVLNSLNASVLGMAAMKDNTDRNFTMSFGKLIEDQRAAAEYVGVYGKSITAKTLPELRQKLAAAVYQEIGLKVEN